MATGAFFNALNYRFYVKAGTTASAIPTVSTGMTEVLSLTNAGIQTQSDTTDVLDYGSPQGYKASIVTGASYNIPMEMNLDLNDAGYAILKQASMDAASGVTVQWYRESPEMSAAGNPEKHAGVAFVTNLSENVQAGSVAKISFTLSGYGAYSWTAETNA
jgi:hypothetical protein